MLRFSQPAHRNGSPSLPAMLTSESDLVALMNSHIEKLISLALQEDICMGDITTEAIISTSAKGRAEIRAKEDLIISGLIVAHKVFKTVDPKMKWTTVCKEGDHLKAKGVIAHIEGSLASILTAERTALNFLQHLSGIATFTKRFVDLAQGNVKILDTRKTIPGLRELQKAAVKAGGGTNHRMGLYDLYMIKNNHITADGGIKEAIAKIKKHVGASGRSPLRIEVETRTLDEVHIAAEAHVDIIMLDNMSPDMIREAVAITKKYSPRSLLEASGNMTLETLPNYLSTGIDFISVGSLTHSAPAVDIHLVIRPLSKQMRYG